MMLIIISLFTLDIIYSTDASGPKQTNALNEYFKSHLTEESLLLGGKPVGYLQAWSRIWTWDYPWTNPASGQGGTSTWGLRITSQAL